MDSNWNVWGSAKYMKFGQVLFIYLFYSFWEQSLFHSVAQPLYKDICIQSRANNNLLSANSLVLSLSFHYHFSFWQSLSFCNKTKWWFATSWQSSQAWIGNFTSFPVPFVLSSKKNKLLHKFHFNQMTDCYTNFVLWSIKIIQFTKHWNNLGNLPQGQSIKKYPLLQLFKSLHTNLFKDLAVTENTLNANIKQHRNLVDLYCQHVEQEKTLIEENLCEFEDRHCCLITTHNTLLYLYTKLSKTL